MDVDMKKEESSTPDKCRCCLQGGELKELWSEYVNDDGVLIYGQALVECFSLALHQPEDIVEMICATCIGKLQDANAFKMLVVESDKKMLEQYFPGEEVNMSENEYYQDDQQALSDDNETSDGDNEKFNPEHLEIEILEAAGSHEPINTKYPVPKKLKKNTCKQRSPAKKSGVATSVNEPKNKTYEHMKDDENSMANKNEIKEKYKSFLKEIKTILKFTNATPYKSKTGQYSCAYCRKYIDDPEELRSHTSTVHAGERFSGVDVFMKASWLNEIIKVDIMDLRCIICPAPIDTWNNMFVHLKKKHKIELDEAYTKVIPFKLTEPLTCVLCGENCNSYTILDAHMNSHYSNYICGDCGDTFLAECRLKKHLEIHSTTKYKCPFCPKFFTLEKYRKKHVDGVHQHSLLFKCRYCDEEFVNEYRRHQHMEKDHSEKLKTISCEYCEKTFTFRPYYLKHVRLSHKKKDVKNHKCTECDKMFSMKHQLKKHMEWHLGHLKQTCLLCNKTFSSKQYLKTHYTKAHYDAEVIVLETDQS